MDDGNRRPHLVIVLGSGRRQQESEMRLRLAQLPCSGAAPWSPCTIPCFERAISWQTQCLARISRFLVSSRLASHTPSATGDQQLGLQEQPLQFPGSPGAGAGGGAEGTAGPCQMFFQSQLLITTPALLLLVMHQHPSFSTMPGPRPAHQHHHHLAAAAAVGQARMMKSLTFLVLLAATAPGDQVLWRPWRTGSGIVHQ